MGNTPKSPQETAETAQPQKPGLADNLAILAARADRMEAEVEQYAGTNEFPEWWYQASVKITTLKRQINEPGTDPNVIAGYYGLFVKENDLKAKISGFDSTVYPLEAFGEAIGTEAAARGFAAEDADGPMHQEMLDCLAEAADTRGEVAPVMEILRQGTGTETLTDLLGLRGDAYSDALQPVLRRENIIRFMRNADQGDKDGDGWSVVTAKQHAWTARALSTALGIDETEASEYTFAASRTYENKPVVDILERFEHFGVERLRAISAFTGIKAFEDYTVNQLERMEDLMRNPKEMAERLSNHDVNVVMVNRVGDNGTVLSEAADIFDDKKKRALFFEIEQLSDIYRYMGVLDKLGIHASSLALAAHSNKGQFIVTDIRNPERKRMGVATVAGRNLVQKVRESGEEKAGEYSFSMHGMKGLARIVETMMQPSRGIDDAAEDAGTKKVIFMACHSANEVENKDLDEQGNEYDIGMESIASRLGNDLAASGVKSKVDIYGAPTGIQLHKSARGARYSTMPMTESGERTPQHAVRIRVENGKVSKQEVDEVVLRQL